MIQEAVKKACKKVSSSYVSLSNYFAPTRHTKYYVLKACRKSATAEAAMTRGKYVVVCGKDFMFVISLVSCLAWAR